jgi:hypothetical protein
LTVVLATIATIFLLMPGFAFIAGVNVTDKNVREIVFRGTPAELAYVVAVSVIVHFLFTLVPSGWVNPGSLLERYVDWNRLDATTAARGLRPIVSAALFYFLASSIVGGCFGYLLGKAVQRWPVRFFIKHQWMVALISGGEREAIFARALTTRTYSMPDEKGDFAIVIEGTVRDCFFAADGTLLYLVFTTYQEKVVLLDGNPLLDPATRSGEQTFAAVRTGAASLEGGRLVLEGRNVAMVQYFDRRDASRVSSQDARARIARAIEEEDDYQVPTA